MFKPNSELELKSTIPYVDTGLFNLHFQWFLSDESYIQSIKSTSFPLTINMQLVLFYVVYTYNNSSWSSRGGKQSSLHAAGHIGGTHVRCVYSFSVLYYLSADDKQQCTGKLDLNGVYIYITTSCFC